MRIHASAAGLVGAIVGGLAACDPEILTARRQVQLKAELQSGDFVSGADIVERSRVCVEFVGHRASAAEPPVFTEASDAQLRACYEQRLVGPGAFADGCVALDVPGDVHWILERQRCPIAGPFGDDSVRFAVRPIAQVRGAFEQALPWPDALRGTAIDVEPEALPAGYFATVGAPLYVVEGTLDAIATRVVRDDGPTAVAFSDGRAHAVALRGSPSFAADDDDPSARLGFEARAGDDFHVSLALPAGVLEVGDVHVVAPSEIAAVTWSPLVVRVRDTDGFLHVGAMAVAYDADGHVLREPGARWQVIDGDAALETFDNDDDGEPDESAWANLLDVCAGAEAGDAREATLRGRMGELEGTVTVRWQCLEDHPTDGGCGCRPDGPRASAWWLLALLAPRRRRRRG